MRTSESIKNLAPALLKANTQLEAIGKSGHNQHDGYKYAKLEDYMAGIKPVLDPLGLFVTFSVTEAMAQPNRVTKNGTENYAVLVHVVARVTHAESGEWQEIDVWGEGQDRADKSTYKGITGARKYGLACLFNLTTHDDPERDESVGVEGGMRGTGGNGQGKAGNAANRRISDVNELL